MNFLGVMAFKYEGKVNDPLPGYKDTFEFSLAVVITLCGLVLF